MSENKIGKMMYQKMMNMLDKMKKNPDSITDEDKKSLELLYSKLCKALGVSEHSQWRVQWRVEKWFDTAKKLAGFAPDEVVTDTQNIVLDSGANEMLKLITGTGGTAFSSANAYMYVGTDTSPENASQNGVLATGNNRAYATVDAGYPVVSNRQMIYRASFGDDSANFAWNEASITNGIGTNSISMNRKVSPLGTKTTGTWVLEIRISLTST